MMRKSIVIHIFFLIAAGLVYWQGIPTNGPDLVWNMILALVAYDLACLARNIKKTWVLVPVLLAWLAFYPNTFYMITDLVHMSWVSQTLWDRASLKLFMAFVPSIWFGVLCGIESWNLVRERLKLSWFWTYLSVPILSFISSLAIYIGRYDRLNSWDLLQQPGEVYTRLLASLQQERLLFVLGFTLIQTMCLLFMDQSEKK